MQNPTIETLIELARIYRMTVDQLVTGELPLQPPTAPDGELLGRLNEAIARVYKDEGVILSELELGRIVASEYAAAATQAPSSWPDTARFVGEQHRQRLRTESMGRRAASE